MIVRGETVKVMAALNREGIGIETVQFDKEEYDAQSEAQTLIMFIESHLPLATAFTLYELIRKKHGWVNMRKD